MRTPTYITVRVLFDQRPGAGIAPPTGSAGRSWRHGRVEQPRAAAPHRPERSRMFYRDTLGLAIYREFGSGPDRGTVFFLGGGFLELSGRVAAPPAPGMALWLQVRELTGVRRELGERGVRILREPKREPWGLLEMWIADPDGVRICIVEVPAEHPLRRRD